ncbi:MAG: zinc ribbon domain-containing protein [Methanomassiliicoccales archaeon]|jgi:hypothetical protein
MKCSNCGTDNIVNDAVHCPNCGASLITPSNWDGQQSAPQPQYQQQPAQAPQPQYQQPPQQYYPPQPPKQQNVPTVKNVGMTEVLLLFSGLLLVLAGFGGLSYLRYNYFGAQYPLLGILALLAGLFILASVIMPSMFKSLDKMMGFLVLGISALFFIWGLAALFANNVGGYGAEIVAASLAGLAGAALKLGFIK